MNLLTSPINCCRTTLRSAKSDFFQQDLTTTSINSYLKKIQKISTTIKQ